MRRVITLAAGAALLVVGFGLVGGPAQAAYICSNDATISGVVNDNVLIPAGQECHLADGASIAGNVVGQSGSVLIARGRVRIGGSVTLQQPLHIGMECDNQAPPCTRIGGSLTVSGGGNPSDQGLSELCGTDVAGAFSMTNSTDFWFIGAQCEKNVFHSGVSLSGNSGRVNFVGSTVGGSFNASHNTGGGSVTNNAISGSLNVSNDTPCWYVDLNVVRGSTYTPSACSLG